METKTTIIDAMNAHLDAKAAKSSQIKQLIATKGPQSVKDSIVRSVRDLKRAQYDIDEVLETIETMYGKEYIEFAKSQYRSL